MTKDDTSSSEQVHELIIVNYLIMSFFQVVTRGVENTAATKVKKVPDFRKLHSKWHKKIEKVCTEHCMVKNYIPLN